MDKRILALYIGLSGLIILFIFVIIYRSIIVYQKRKRILKAIENADKESKSILKILEPLLEPANYPPLLLFKITKEKALEILKENHGLMLLEQKCLFNYYKYFIIYSPCIFVFKTKDIIKSGNKIKVKSYVSQIMLVSRLDKDNNYFR